MTQRACLLGGLSWSEQEVGFQRPLGLQGLEIKAVWFQVFMGEKNAHREETGVLKGSGWLSGDPTA